MDKHLAAQLYKAGKEMRAAQKRHQASGSYANNRCRVEAERIFDEMLKRCAQGAPQGSLFSGNTE